MKFKTGTRCPRRGLLFHSGTCLSVGVRRARALCALSFDRSGWKDERAAKRDPTTEKKSDTAGNKIWLAGWMEGRWVERECFNCKWNFNWKREAKSRAWQDGKNHQWQSLSDFRTLMLLFCCVFFIFHLWNHSTKNFALGLISTRPGLCC